MSLSQDTRTHVVGELYDTERSYVESLQILVEVSDEKVLYIILFANGRKQKFASMILQRTQALIEKLKEL